MDNNVSHGPWHQLKIQLRKTWSELTDEDLAAVSRDFHNLVEVVQHRYACQRAEVIMPLRIVQREFLIDPCLLETTRAPYSPKVLDRLEEVVEPGWSIRPE